MIQIHNHNKIHHCRLCGKEISLTDRCCQVCKMYMDEKDVMLYSPLFQDIQFKMGNYRVKAPYERNVMYIIYLSFGEFVVCQYK